MLRHLRIEPRRAIAFAGTLLGLAAGTGFAQEPFLDGQVAPEGDGFFPRNASLRGAGIPDLYLVSNQVVTAPIDRARLIAEDSVLTELGPLRMGVVQDFAPMTGDQGIWAPLAGGDEGWIWTASFKAPGAQGVRLRIEPWHPPIGAELVLYDAAEPAESFGPLTTRHRAVGERFWTPVVYGDEVCVEYYLPPGIDPTDPASQLAVTGLLNQYRTPWGDSTAGEESGILPCHLDVTCFPAFAGSANGVGALSFVSGPFGFFCSGSMVNRIPSDFTSFFLTARHCGVTESNADSLLVTWFYQTPTCNGTPPDVTTLPQTPGVTVLVQDAGSDYTLVGLENPGLAITYLGWDANGWANGSAGTMIHHPGGSWKRISFGNKQFNTTAGCAVGTADYHYVTRANGQGEIEPGSSGSPILDSFQRVRGTASCATWGCSSSVDGTWYGRFDSAYPEFQWYLNAVDPIFVQASATGPETGTIADPFNRMVEGMFAVHGGSDVFALPGTYDEEFTMDKAMTIHSTGGSVIIR